MACTSSACCSRHPKACTALPLPPARITLPYDTLPSQSDSLRHASARQLLRAASIGGALAVSHTNGPNLPFARNWYVHLRRAGVSNFALLATDDEASSALMKELGPRVVRCPNHIAPRHAQTGLLRYRSAGWTKLMFAVPRMLLWVLSFEIDVLWMDTDVAALSNPFPVLASLLQGKSREELPLLASVDGRVPQEDLAECAHSYSRNERWGGSSGGWKLCGGLFFIRHSEASLDFLRSWERRLSEPHAGAKNQPHFNQALQSTRMPFALMPCAQFPNGYRYASTAWRSRFNGQAVLVHNNWIKGHEAKLERFRQWGMWLLPSALVSKNVTK